MSCSKDEILVKILIQDSIFNHAKIFGIEGVEQKIKEVYSLCPTLKSAFLKEYNEIFKNN